MRIKRTPAAGAHPDLATHDTLGLATDAELATHAATPHGGAPSDADYLVGTAHAGLSAEIVVGTTPNGELGGTWGAITVDASHSGSTHAATQAAAEAAAASALSGHAALEDVHHANDNDPTAGQKAALAGTSGTPGVGNEYVTDDDPRNSDSRTPTAHDIDGALHNGFPGGTTTFLRADGTFATPTATASDPFYAPGSFTLATGTYRVMASNLILNGTEEATLEGDATLVII